MHFFLLFVSAAGPEECGVVSCNVDTKRYKRNVKINQLCPKRGEKRGNMTDHFAVCCKITAAGRVQRVQNQREKAFIILHQEAFSIISAVLLLPWLPRWYLPAVLR